MAEMVVSPDWLAEHRDAVRIVDVRDAWEYEGIGHVPGAVNVPFDSFRAEEHAAERGTDPDSAADGASPETADDRGMLPGAERFARLMGEAGIERTDHVVAYDDTHGVFAARLLVTAELYGHPREKLSLLDGDFSAWRMERAVTDEVPSVEPTAYDVAPPTETPLVDADAVENAIGTDTVLVDTREAWEYDEGHIPGAVRLDWMELVDQETRGLKPRERLESLLHERGITPDRRVLLYCNTARRISHTYLVLRHLGYEDLAFYEGSLTEWKAMGKPVETG